MEILSAILLGIIQGITEWLPVSSSAHMALANIYLGLGASVEFQVALNLGTLLALLAYTRNDLLSIGEGLLSKNRETLSLIKLIIIAGIPTALIGFSGKAFFEGLYSSPKAIGIALIITGILLFLTKLAKKANEKMSPGSALAQGIAQGIAVAPGISRSGSTISAALLLGAKPEEAARFSFLIGIPAFSVASAIEIFQAGSSLSFDPDLFAIGIIVSGAVGYLSIGFLIRTLKQGSFHLFSYYCIILGLLAIFFSQSA